MQLIVLGLNHKTAPVEVREGFNFSADRIARILRRRRNDDNLDEAVLLSRLHPRRVLHGAGRTRKRHKVHPDAS